VFLDGILFVATLTRLDHAAMANPFDLRTILLAKHAQHVVLVHFPIALFMSGVGLDLLPRGQRDSQLASAAYWNLSIAAASVIPTALTGLLAWYFALEGERIKGLLLLHAIAASIATVLVIASWWVHWRTRMTPVPLPRYRIPVELLGVAAIALTAHLGGFVSGVNR
jgi:uncharacterized membrane protein